MFVGFPIWWYVAPTIINTFLEQYSLTGKTIVPFATSGGSGMGQTNVKLLPSCLGAKLVQGKVFQSGAAHEELWVCPEYRQWNGWLKQQGSKLIGRLP